MGKSRENLRISLDSLSWASSCQNKESFGMCLTFDLLLTLGK